MSKNAYSALAKAQTEMGKAVKNATNPHFKKPYADLRSVQDACLEALHDNGFAVLQPTGQDDMGFFVQTIFAHESGETLECRTPLIVDRNNMQGLGSAITYARRYGLLCMSGLAPEDDDGNATVQQSNPFERDFGSPKAPALQPDAATEASLLSDCMASLQSCTTLKELADTFKAVQEKWHADLGTPFPGKIVEEKERLKGVLGNVAYLDPPQSGQEAPF